MGTQVKRGAGVAMVVALVAAIGTLGYGVSAAASKIESTPSDTAGISAPPAPSPAGNPSTGTSVPAPETPVPTTSPTSEPAAPETPEPEAPAPAPPVLSPGDKGPEVRDLQARLRQIDWYAGKVTDTYGDLTAEAVRGFQAKRGLPDLGYVDKATLKRLHAMTREPTKNELANKVSDGTWTDAPLDPRCTTGRVMCVDKSSRTIRWVVDGTVSATMAVRFGSSYTPTREGLFHVESKSRDHVSSLYGTPMPFAMFFSRGQAVHYSPDFAARGYAGASHGCVNVRDYDGIKALFDLVRVGDKVVVYWS